MEFELVFSLLLAIIFESIIGLVLLYRQFARKQYSMIS